jgi:hypothetical protein
VGQVTPPAQVLVNLHSTEHEQALSQTMPPAQLPAPRQLTLHGPAPQVMAAPQVSKSLQSTSQLLALLQSTPPGQAFQPVQSTSQSNPAGQMTLLGHEPQLIWQTVPLQLLHTAGQPVGLSRDTAWSGAGGPSIVGPSITGVVSAFGVVSTFGMASTFGVVSAFVGISGPASGATATQTLVEPQVNPRTLQMPPAQHGCPPPPHGVHLPAAHIRVVLLQVSLAQHRSPAPPQPTHFPATQLRFDPVQTSFLQQASPAPPQ